MYVWLEDKQISLSYTLCHQFRTGISVLTLFGQRRCKAFQRLLNRERKRPSIPDRPRDRPLRCQLAPPGIQ